MTGWLPQSWVLRPGTVLDTYPGLGLGNYLYFALNAHGDPERRTWVLDTGLDPAWRLALPRLVPLLVARREAALRRRVPIPPGFHQGYGVDFSAAGLEEFVREVILAPGPPSSTPTPDVVVNVRRGDYYSHPGRRSIYGFDVVDYVRRAVSAVTADARPSWLSVVSDDPSWCSTSLSWLGAHADRVTFGAQDPGPVGDFWEVARARTVVLTNSTFSYWAGYVSQVLHPEEHRIWVPDFHQRNLDEGRPWQHDPRWHALSVAEVAD